VLVGTTKVQSTVSATINRTTGKPSLHRPTRRDKTVVFRRVGVGGMNWILDDSLKTVADGKYEK